MSRQVSRVSRRAKHGANRAIRSSGKPTCAASSTLAAAAVGSLFRSTGRHDHGSRASFPVYWSTSLPCQARVMLSREERPRPATTHTTSRTTTAVSGICGLLVTGSLRRMSINNPSFCFLQRWHWPVGGRFAWSGEGEPPEDRMRWRRPGSTANFCHALSMNLIQRSEKSQHTAPFRAGRATAMAMIFDLPPAK